MKRIYNKFRTFNLDDYKFIILLPILMVISRLHKMSPNYKRYWLISERPYEARDNGYHLFKYIRLNHPEIEAYYVIDKNCSDYNKVKHLGNIVHYKSLKHLYLFAVGHYQISAHKGICDPNIKFYDFIRKNKIFKNKEIFLQHGVIKDYIDWLVYQDTGFDLFVCGAKPEYEYVKEVYGYPEGYVKYLGLCRFDALSWEHKVEKKQILVMPTWRQWFQHNDDKEITTKEVLAFKESEYFQQYNNLINHETLHDYLTEYSLTLVLYLHPNLQKYSSEFNSKSLNIVVANKDEYDIQQLLMESKLLITDYSSIYFDFAYMNKPIHYFHFDYQEYRKHQYSEGYFDYNTHGFGMISNNLDELISNVIDSIINNFENPKQYLERINTFFELRDQRNCERNFRAIIELD